MNLKTWIPAIAALVLGGIAAKVARDSIFHSHATAIKADMSVVKVVTVKTPIQIGQEISADHSALTPILGQTPPPNTFTDLAAVTGRIANAPMFVGQTIFDGSLAPRGATRGLAALIPAGMRAITIDVNETSSLAGMLVPGCHVDAVSIFTPGGATSATARTVAQNVLVQAVGQRLSSARPEEPEGGKKSEARAEVYRSVTLIVTPREAHTLQLASTNTRMTLLLRAPGDAASDDDDSITIADLLGNSDVIEQPGVASAPATQPAPQVAAAPEPSQSRIVELIRGGNSKTRVVFKITAPTAISDTADQLTPVVPDTGDQPEE